MANSIVKLETKAGDGRLQRPSLRAHEPHVREPDLYEDMLERARALVPNLKARAAETERLRHVHPETARELHDQGLYRILQPRRIGGSELDYVALVDVAAALARGDASVAWTQANLASHHWMLGMFEPATQDLVWRENPDVLIASSFVFPSGHASRVEGGYRLTGRWPFSSGVGISDWNMLAGIVASDDEAEGSEYRVFLLRKRDYQVIDTWSSAGLRGTGSNDVEVRDVFVPQAMTLAVADLKGGATPGSRANPSALYRLPVFALFPYVLAGIALGNAQACYEDYVTSARSRASRYNLAKLADFQSTQIRIADASAKIDAASRIMRGTCMEAMVEAEQGIVPDLLTKSRYRRDGAFAVNLCTQAVGELFAASGAGALFDANPLQRQFRDAHAVNAHIAFSFDAAGTNFGRVALGFDTENVTL